MKANLFFPRAFGLYQSYYQRTASSRSDVSQPEKRSRSHLWAGPTPAKGGETDGKNCDSRRVMQKLPLLYRCLSAKDHPGRRDQQ